MPVTGGLYGWWLWGGIGLGAAMLTIAFIRRYDRRRRNSGR